MNELYTQRFQRQKPSLMFADIVEEYTFREIKFNSAGVIRKEMPCRHINSIDFFLAGRYTTHDPAVSENLPFVRSTIRGPRTYRKYSIVIDQDFICFSIRFKPTGIYKLLGIPMHEFSNQAIDSTLVVPDLFNNLIDKLMCCKDLLSCVLATEILLTRKISKSALTSSPMSNLAEALHKKDIPQRIGQFYKSIPLSARHIERNFIKEVGVSPKTYHNLIRFENVIKARNAQPDILWSSIAYELNYFDQMHLIKDFKKFLGIRPTEFKPVNFAL